MAWNQPSGKTRVNTKKSKGMSWTVVAVVVLAVGGGAWWLLSSDTTEPSATSEPSPVEITAAAETNAAPSAVEPPTVDEEHKGMVKYRGKWYPEYDKDGGKIWITGYGVRYHTPTVRTNHFNEALISPERKIFENRADQDIAILLNTKPGTTYIGGFKFGKRFEEDFLASIENPIIVKESDPPEVADLKRAVNEAKLDLKDRYDAGEDIVQIMNDTLTEFKKLAAYRDELLKLTRETIQKDRPSAEETKIIYEAANKMLAERGIQPLHMPVMLKNSLKLQVKKEK